MSYVLMGYALVFICGYLSTSKLVSNKGNLVIVSLKSLCNMPKKIASLFSGCGGLDLGFTGGFYFGKHYFERLNQKSFLQMTLIKMLILATMQIIY